MGRIQTLTPSVINRIAAGEVIERPASVVKEFLENAIDSGASRIAVELHQGGTSLVRVVDDGEGIEPDDLLLAVAPHATSKLFVAEDLDTIRSLGFRGEALASIGEVSRLVIRSRVKGRSHGAAIEIDGGKLGEVIPDGGAEGTTIESHQLFWNVPARRAFLKTASTEFSHASEAFVRTALAHPSVAFSLTHGPRVVHDLAATTLWRSRIGGIFGTDLADRLLEVEASDNEISVSGFVGRPEDDVAGSRMQYLFVGGRPFRDRTILHAIHEAYRGILLSGRQPMVFLRFDIPAESVDVNVHPTKIEVRFLNPSRLHRLVLSALRTKFLTSNLKAPLRPPVDPLRSFGPLAPAATVPPSFKSFAESTSRLFFEKSISEPGSIDVNATQDRTWLVKSQLEVTEALSPRVPADEFSVQMHDRYIVVESKEGIEVIDQHALHEQVLFARLKESVRGGTLEVQPLLVPEPVELTHSQAHLIMEHSEALEGAGVKVESFGGSTILVTSKPVLVGKTPAVSLIRELLERLECSSQSAGEVIVDEVLHGLACKAAVKAGDPLSEGEVNALVRDRHIIEHSHHCPHGRPTSLTLSKEELDRQFRRT